MAAYTIVRVDVHDADEYAKYAALAAKAVEKFGGEFLVRGGTCEHIEGTGRARNVVTKFKDFETAKAWYNSPEYQEALAFALPAATRDLTIVEGV